MNLDNFKHIIHRDGGKKTLLLLHGTGGDEHDLWPLVDGVSGYTVVGLRGNVVEAGMNRFFRRLEPGVFDEVNIREEAEKLAQFVMAWKDNYDSEVVEYLGYSNGANMILALAFLYPEMVQRAMVMHPMLPLEPDSELDLSEAEFWVSWGMRDMMVPAGETEALVQILKQHTAHVREIVHEGGHELREIEYTAVRQFLE